MEKTRRAAGALALAAVLLAGAAKTELLWEAFHSTRSAFGYYEALEKTGVPAGFFTKAAYSLLLASADSSKAKPRQTPPASD